MPFQPVLDWLLRPAPDDADLGPLPGIGALPAAFSDDLVVGGRRLAIRVIITDDGSGGYRVDASESEAYPAGVASPAHVHAAITAGFSLALGRAPTTGLARRIQAELGGICGGAGEPASPELAAFVTSRVLDAVLGALQRVWPADVGAGSCSLGGLVQIDTPSGSLIDVLPGGEGARADRVGATAWPPPMINAPRPEGMKDLTIAREVRADSGGIGARRGGDGVRVCYTVSAPSVAHVRVDRVANPPHGIDRAGPPRGSVVALELGDEARAVEPWSAVDLPAGATLVVETCGGAGHGFPGYGDIEFDDSEWFGDSTGESQ